MSRGNAQGATQNSQLTTQYLFRAFEKYIFAQAFRASHEHFVNFLAEDADPGPAGIASPAEQQPPESQASAAMRIRSLRDPVFFPPGKTGCKMKCIQFIGQTLFAPLIGLPYLWPKTGNK